MEDTDSGIEMPGLGESSSNTPEMIKSAADNSDDIDETVMERLWGLTEMFPEGLRGGVSNVASSTVSGISSTYGFLRSTVWVVFSTSAVLIIPLMFEVERATMKEQQNAQQRQMLLGPGAALSPGMNMPPGHR